MTAVQNRHFLQQHVIRTFEVTHKDGLPVTQLREEVVTTSKSRCCIRVLRASVGTVGAGVGALSGMLIGPFIYGTTLQYLWPGCFNRIDAHGDLDNHVWIVMCGMGSSSLMGTGCGAIVGRKVSTCVFDGIFGKEKVIKTPID